MSQSDQDLLRLSPPPSAPPTEDTDQQHQTMIPCDIENIDPKSSSSCDATCDDNADDDVVLQESRSETTRSELDSENMPPSRDMYPNSYRFHHHQHCHHDPFYHLTLEPSPEGNGVVTVMHHPLPLSPSMTPPIALSPSPSSHHLSSTEESDSESNSSLSGCCSHSTTSSSSVANSPLSLASSDEEDEEEELLEAHHSTPTKESPGKEEPARELSPRLSRSRPGSLRQSRSSQRFSPYARHLSHQGVLRPINGDHSQQQLTSEVVTSRLRSHHNHVDSSINCDTTLDDISTTTEDAVDKSVLESSINQDTSSNSIHHHSHANHHQQLHIDTQLANSQCAAAQHESRAAKTALAQRILSVIRADNFEDFLAILRQNKPDLNVFVNGQTALHYCLMLGRDVSWCKQLVANGANPNLSNQDGWHPLHLAAFRGLADNLNYLISCNSANNAGYNGGAPAPATNSHRGGGDHSHPTAAAAQ